MKTRYKFIEEKEDGNLKSVMGNQKGNQKWKIGKNM